MASFDELKKIAKETAEVIADRSAVFARTAADKAKIVARMTKLSADMASEKEMLRKLYLEIGKNYYDLADQFPVGDIQPLINAAKAANDRLGAKKAEIEDLKLELRSGGDGAVDVEFEEVAEDEAESGAEEECCCGCCSEEKSADVQGEDKGSDVDECCDTGMSDTGSGADGADGEEAKS